MACMNSLQKQRGFSLVEAMFSALILGIALLGLAGFHAVALQDGTLVKARSVAANLAQEKLDDLRSFTGLVDNPSTTAVNECAAPTFCFSEIAQNAGGAEESGGTLVLPSGAVAGYIDNYTLAWTVTCSTETAGSALSFGSACTGATAKLATVTVSWTDSKGASQSVSLQGVIYAMDPARLAMGAASSFSTQKPVAGYTPIGVPDAVPVPISTGTGEFKESSKPVPDVISSDTGVEVSFDAVSYASNGSGGYNTTAKEEFVTASCECAFGSGTGYTPSRMVWNGAGLEAKIGEPISKTVGTAANGQSELCAVCCNDHHDVAGTSQPKYDPDRPDSEYVGGNHKHYWYSECVSGGAGAVNCTKGEKDTSLSSDTPLTAVTSGAYLESCRVKRVDGFWRVWQDWRLVKMTVIPYDYLLTTANLDAYVGVIEAVVEKAIRTDSGNGSTSIPTLSNRDITFTAQGEVKQLLGRAVYVDRIYQEDNPAVLDSAYYTKLVELIGADSDWLNIVPFYEANLTLLIDWTSSHADKASVTSQQIVDINDISSGYYNSYSRGKVTAIAAGTATITATARLHNSGVTGGISTSSPSYGISGYDNIGPLSDFITASVPGSPASVGISGKFVRANTSVNFNTLQLAGATCTLQPAIGNALPYTCTVTSGTNVTLSYSSSASGYDLTPASHAFGSVTTALEAGDVTVYGPTVQISGSITSSGGGKLTSVSGTGGLTCNPIANGDKSYSCTVARGTSGYSGTITFAGDSPSPSTQVFAGQQADAVLNVSVSK